MISALYLQAQVDIIPQLRAAKKLLNFPEVINTLPAKVASCPQNRSGKANLELPGS
jgi:hypothetical protein